MLSQVAVHAPLPEVMVDGRPSGEVVREQAPLAAAPQEVEDGVEDLARAMDPRSPMSLGSGQVRLDVIPLGIGKVRWVRSSHTC